MTRIYLPTPGRYGAGPAGRAVPRPPVPRIAGNEFAILTNGWEAMGPLAAHLSRRLLAAGAREVHVIARDRINSGAARPEADPFVDALAQRVVGAITGLGN